MNEIVFFFSLNKNIFPVKSLYEIKLPLFHYLRNLTYSISTCFLYENTIYSIQYSFLRAPLESTHIKCNRSGIVSNCISVVSFTWEAMYTYQVQSERDSIHLYFRCVLHHGSNDYWRLQLQMKPSFDKLSSSSQWRMIGHQHDFLERM